MPVELTCRRIGAVGLVGLLLLSCGARENDAPADVTIVPTGPSARDGKGTAELSPADPVPARGRGTWTFTFTVGEGGIPAGGGVAFQVSPFWGWSPPQNLNEAAPGYCTVRTSSATAGIEVTCNTDRYYLLVTVQRGSLDPGETVIINYGDTGGGTHPTAAARADMYAERYQEFLFKTDGDGDGVYGEIPEQPRLEIAPREAVQLWVNAPSLVAPGEPFGISVAALDGMGNRAEGYEGTVSLVSNPPGADFDGACRLEVRDRGAKRIGVRIPEPGLYSIAASAAGGLAAVSNPVLCGEGRLFPHVYWGDIHGHSMLSDGTGHPDDYYAYARDVAGLDVAALTDHDSFGLRPLPGEPWRMCLEAVARYHEPGRFVTLVGYEWTSWTYGHRNVYFPGDSGHVFPYDDLSTATPRGLWKALEPWGAITIAHHVGGGPIATDWDERPPPGSEMLVEVFSVHGNSERFRGERMIYSPVEGHFVQDALARGYRLGILASGDGHIGHTGRWTSDYTQGLVAFQAKELTREAIWEALTSRRVYGTSGARVLLDFTVNGHPMGSDVPDDAMHAPRSIEIRVLGTAPLAAVHLIKNKQEIQTFVCEGQLETFQFVDNSRGKRGDYYYARVVQTDGHMAWSSPVWLGSDD
jgi:hypothetical protein